MTTRAKRDRNFGDFELLQRIGRDGPFHLFRARQVSLDRLVTLKTLPERLATLERTAILRREAEAGNRLDHAGILRFYEAGDVAGAPYLALAPIDGIQLAERLKTGALPPRLALDLARQMAEALAHAHEHSVTHGALRPEVVWITRDGQMRLSGFGCPIQFEELDTSAVAGSAGYLAPEQAGGRGAVGRATDLYGVGALLYAMTTGVPPHQGATVAETCRLIRSQPPVRPSRLRPGLAPALDAICAKCLHLSPTRRYGTDRPWTRLLADMRRVRSGRTEDPDPSQRVVGWFRRYGRFVRVAALLFVFALIPASWDRYRHSGAWETIVSADASVEEYAGAARHFERLAADRPFDPQTASGLLLARFRTAQPVANAVEEPPNWRGVHDEWTAIRNLTRVLQAIRANRRDTARAAMQTARASGYSPRNDREQKLYDECLRRLGDLK